MLGLPFDELVPDARFTTRGRTVTEADVCAFASLTGDFHPQHTDAQWAARGPFGERIAHGMLVLAYAAGLVPFDPERVMALRRVRDATFKRPVHLGDTITVHGRVAALAPVDSGAGLVTVGLTVTGRAGQTVMRATIEVLWRRDPVSVRDEDDDLEAGPEIDPSGLVYALTSVPL